MKSIDSEIAAVEERIATRKVAMAMTAAAAKTRSRQLLMSPVTLGGAAVAGLVIGVVLLRRKKQQRQQRPVRTIERRRVVKEKEHGKGFALGTLAMTGLTWVVRSQFGGPMGLAHYVLEKLRDRAEAASGVEPERRAVPTAPPAHLGR